VYENTFHPYKNYATLRLRVRIKDYLPNWYFILLVFKLHVDTGGNLLPVSLTPVANLPPVSLIPVVHLDLRISPRLFEKIENGPNLILWGWGETNS
jgi:hypothetical protein